MFKRANLALVAASVMFLGSSAHAVGVYDGLISAVSVTDIVTAMGAIALVAVGLILARNGFKTVLGMIRGTAK